MTLPTVTTKSGQVIAVNNYIKSEHAKGKITDEQLIALDKKLTANTLPPESTVPPLVVKLNSLARAVKVAVQYAGLCNMKVFDETGTTVEFDMSKEESEGVDKLKARLGSALLEVDKAYQNLKDLGK